MAYTVLKWTEPDPSAAIAAGWDSMLVEREDLTGWNLVTRGANFIPIVIGMADYLFNDVQGDASKNYRFLYYNRNTGASSVVAGITDKTDVELYASVQDLRDEGFPATYTDAQLARALEWARAFVEKATRQFFNPRYRALKLDGRANLGSDGGLRYLLPHPIIVLMEMEVDGSPIDRTGLATYNRHLTAGIRVPSDPASPRLEFRDTLDYPFDNIDLNLESWLGGAQWVTVRGLFGWTELDSDDEVGETEIDSGVPLSYGITPPLIKRATLKLGAMFADTMYESSGSGGGVGPIYEEKTRDQSYKRVAPSGAVLGDGATGDPELDAILRGYRTITSMLGAA